MHKLIVGSLVAALLLGGCGGPSPQQRFAADVAVVKLSVTTISSDSIDTKIKPPTAEFRMVGQPGKDPASDLGHIISKVYDDKTLNVGDTTFVYSVPVGTIPLNVMTFVVHRQGILRHIKNGVLESLSFDQDPAALEVTNFNVANAIAAGLSK